MFLLATVTLCCSAVAGALTLLEPMLGQPMLGQMLGQIPGPAHERLVAERGAIDVTRVSDQTPVRVVGAPFEPNVNPRQR